MPDNLDEMLRQAAIFRRLSSDDRRRLASVAHVRAYDKGAVIFSEEGRFAHN